MVCHGAILHHTAEMLADKGLPLAPRFANCELRSITMRPEDGGVMLE